ncbi:MAG: AmmeMemoRadiSam system protein B [Chlorobiaceae bacterium]|nr:AmmeMemoRadiSam system protein B [Chlorobiaceae bacterium]NTV24883.1 AmmeMemoRadiSam system protein B [Chlorobiaceae bacterium]
MQPNIRYPAVAEEFYPSETHELEALLETLFRDKPAPDKGNKVRGLIVPHAAYRYCGQVSAKAFSSAAGRAYRTVFLMGNAHAYLFDGIAIDPHEAWSSPIGKVPVNRKLSRKLTKAAPGLFHELDIAHHCDHVLEVQIPFLQHALAPGFTILPMLFGENSPDIYRKAADSIMSVMSDEDLIVASTDLSHYPSYRDAGKIDHVTLEHMTNRDVENLERHESEVMQRIIPGATSAFCSPDAVKTLLEIARRKGWTPGEPTYLNSGDTAHDDRLAVVGYGSVSFSET